MAIAQDYIFTYCQLFSVVIFQGERPYHEEQINSCLIEIFFGVTFHHFMTKTKDGCQAPLFLPSSTFSSSARQVWRGRVHSLNNLFCQISCSWQIFLWNASHLTKISASASRGRGLITRGWEPHEVVLSPISSSFDQEMCLKFDQFNFTFRLDWNTNAIEWSRNVPI